MTYQRMLGGVAVAALVLGLPLAGLAQTDQQAVIFSSALANIDQETRMLATMSNQIPSREVVPVSIDRLQLDGTTRYALARTASTGRRAALQAALGKIMVADENRVNGESEDQSTLAEYLQQLGIDPSKVVAIDIDGSHDRQNPRVTVFYRGRAHTG